MSITSKTPLNPGPVACAGRLKLDENTAPAPSMRNSIMGWFRQIVVQIVQTNFEEGGTVNEVTRDVRTSGFIQPSEPEKLEIQAAGSRSWTYWYLHCLPNLALNTDDRVRIRGKSYLVIGKKDWSSFGYIRYRLLKDYEDANPDT